MGFFPWLKGKVFFCIECLMSESFHYPSNYPVLHRIKIPNSRLRVEEKKPFLPGFIENQLCLS